MRHLILFFVIIFIVNCSRKTSSEKVAFVDPERIHPELISKGSLVYPDSLINQNIQGIVRVKCLIDTLGNVKEKSIYKSDDSRLNDAALETVSTYKFKPGKYVGKKVESMILIPIKFE